jgi:hypothetical protein
MDEILVKTKQRHRSAEEWRSVVSAWKQSGKARELWCRENHVGKESLRRWTKRLRGTEAEVSFVQIEGAVPVGLKSVSMHLRIFSCGEVVLIGAFSEELLRGVLRVVREAVDVS